MRIIDASTHIWAQPLTKIQQYYASSVLMHMTDNVSTYFHVIYNKQVITHEITMEKKFVRE